MQDSLTVTHRLSRSLRRLGALLTGIALSLPASAQAAGSPWENAVDVLQAAFTGPIAKGLSLIAIVVGGIMFAFSEGGSKRVFAGILFGIGMAVGATSFMQWLFNA